MDEKIKQINNKLKRYCEHLSGKNPFFLIKIMRRKIDISKNVIMILLLVVGVSIHLLIYLVMGQ
jgi:hypothetical protein